MTCFPSNIDAHLRAPGFRLMQFMQAQQQQQQGQMAQAAQATHLQQQMAARSAAAGAAGAPSAPAAAAMRNPEIEMALQDASKVCNPDVKTLFASIEDAVNKCMIDVLACINRWDQYHGDIRLNSFYYKIDMGKPEIRLGDFITDDFKTLEESQLDDWHKMGTLVLEIIDILQQHNITTIIPMLEDLVNFFENLNNVADAEKAYMRAFFMNDEMKTKFMRVSLPFLIEKVGFNVKVNSIEVTLPWEFGKYDCLVTCVEIHNNQNYDRNNIYHFLRVLSATYEHFDLIYRQAFNMTQIGSLLPFTNSLSNFHEYMMIKYPKLVLQLRSIDLDL